MENKDLRMLVLEITEKLWIHQQMNEKRLLLGEDVRSEMSKVVVI
jgi:hypothetical protein